MRLNKTYKFIIAIVVSELAGVIGAIFTTGAIPTWYSTLQKPEFTPPSWFFGYVWVILYFLMGLAAYLVWSSKVSQKKVGSALGMFVVQLAMNASWSVVFFGGHNLTYALIDIGLLWLAIMATINYFGRISKPAAWLLMPYLLWMSFAVYLNYAIWKLN